MCPSLTLVEPDPASAEQEWEAIVRRLEDSGFSVEPAGLGCAYFETRGVERLYGGLKRALEARARSGRLLLGSPGWRGRAPVRRAGGGDRRPSRADPGRLGRTVPVLSRPASTHPVFLSRPAADRSCKTSAYAPSAGSRRSPTPPSPSGWARTGAARTVSPAAARSGACAAGGSRRRSSRRSRSPRRSATSSRSAARSARSSSRCWRGRSGEDGSSARSRSRPGSWAADRGAGLRRSAIRPPSTTG